MSTQIFSSAAGSLPFFTDTNQTTSQTQNQTSNTGATGSNLNVYSDAQKAAQNQALSSLSGFISGQSLPTSVGLSDAERQQAIMDWNQNTAPLLTAQLGAGSPALGSSMQQLILALTAQANQRAQGNFLGGAQALGNFAFTPQGNNTVQNQTASGNTTAAGTNHVLETGFDTNAALNWLTGVLGGQPLNAVGAVPLPMTNNPILASGQPSP